MFRTTMTTGFGALARTRELTSTFPDRSKEILVYNNKHVTELALVIKL